MVTVQGGKLVPMYFKDLRDPVTNKTRVRNVDIRSEGYRVAREYMLRLEPKDFEYSAWVEKLAEAAHLSVGELRSKFEYLCIEVKSGA
jgi:ATP-dependent phosphofructokinase / diphosphate-dependent phosphofructokinase